MIDIVQKAGFGIVDISNPDNSDLEDVFLQLTQN